MSWQPIETAPKDRHILLNFGNPKSGQRPHLGATILGMNSVTNRIFVGHWCKMVTPDGELLGWGELLAWSPPSGEPKGLLFRDEPIEWHEIPLGFA